MGEGIDAAAEEGDTVEIQQQIYPGPRDYKTQGRIVRCVSPTYYEVEYTDHRGTVRTSRFKRSQLP